MRFDFKHVFKVDGAWSSCAEPGEKSRADASRAWRHRNPLTRCGQPAGLTVSSLQLGPRRVAPGSVGEGNVRFASDGHRGTKLLLGALGVLLWVALSALLS